MPIRSPTVVSQHLSKSDKQGWLTKWPPRSLANPVWHGARLCLHWSAIVPLCFHLLQFSLMVGLLHAMTFMVLLLVGWVIWNNKPLPLSTAYLSLCQDGIRGWKQFAVMWIVFTFWRKCFRSCEAGTIVYGKWCFDLYVQWCGSCMVSTE